MRISHQNLLHHCDKSIIQPWSEWTGHRFLQDQDVYLLKYSVLLVIIVCDLQQDQHIAFLKYS